MEKMSRNKLREFVIIVVMIIQVGMNESCIESERNGLLEIRSSFNPDSPLLSSWGNLSDDCCNWKHVFCNSTAGHITVLDLSSIRDFDPEENWYLNASVFLPFQQLNRLHLYDNNIAGCIHNQGFERLSTLTNLEILGLGGNKFNNTVLRSLSGIHSLKSLNLVQNKLKGTVDISELSTLTNTLEELDLRENEIEGFKRMEGRLNKLEYLDISHNVLNSSTFPFLSETSSLRILRLRENNLEGPLNFKELDGLTNLQELDLFGNKITNIVESKGRLNKLEYLDISHNGLNSSVFPFLREISSLRILRFTENNLEGPLNFKELDGLTNLQELDLFGNKITNIVVSKGFNKLKKLNLRNNQFNKTTTTDFFQSGCGLNGSILANTQGLCNLKHLEELDMSYNDLNGNVPRCLGNMSSLQSLRISSNRLRIPVSLSPFFNLSKLRVLDVSNNIMYEDRENHNLIPKFQLQELYMIGYGEGGKIPEFLYHQKNLDIVYICSLKLRGHFPYWLLQNNTRLRALILANNSFSGPIQFPNRPHVNLISLRISDNFFDGSIPSNIGFLFPNLDSLDMSSNELKGSIPDSLRNMSALYSLDLSKNYISGNLPSNFSPSKLEIVDLSKNKIQGSLKDSFYSSRNLFQLDLSHNNFSGTIPSWIGESSELNFLVLGYNNLQGKIPMELCNLKKLSFLDLSHNNIFGHMIPCLNVTNYGSRNRYLRVMEDIEITMKGQIYAYQSVVLNYLSGIDISCNNIDGNIPVEIGNLTRIQALNFSQNFFIGEIPPTFSNLKEIESLDLSLNNLQGTIPHQLTQLTYLSVFNVSYNNLSGPVPNAVNQFGTFNESSYKGNLFLCGLPMSKSCSSANSPPSNARISPNSDNSKNRFIDMEDFFVSFGISYGTVLLTLVAILCINSYWRRVWFYYIQMSIDRTYYFVIDNVIPLFSKL